MADPSTSTGSSITMPSVARPLRIAAMAEGVSYLLLLGTTVAKYVFEAGGEGGVPVAGPIHGIIVLVYAALVLMGRDEQGWSLTRTLIALVLSAVPLGGFYVERTMLTVPDRAATT